MTTFEFIWEYFKQLAINPRQPTYLTYFFQDLILSWFVALTLTFMEHFSSHSSVFVYFFLKSRSEVQVQLADLSWR